MSLENHNANKFVEETIEQPLVELRLRRQKLEPFVAEAAEVEWAIKELEKLHEKAENRRLKKDKGKALNSGVVGTATRAGNTRGAGKAKVLDFLKSNNAQPVSPKEATTVTNLNGAYVTKLLKELAESTDQPVEKCGRGQYRYVPNHPTLASKSDGSNVNGDGTDESRAKAAS